MQLDDIEFGVSVYGIKSTSVYFLLILMRFNDCLISIYVIFGCDDFVYIIFLKLKDIATAEDLI
jgi:hypothetical protein